MSIEEAAEKFKSWAHEQGILTYDPPEILEEPDALDDLTDTADPAVALTVLRRRKINFVGVNPTSNKIVVATHQKLTKGEMEAMPESAEGEYEFEFIKSPPPEIRNASGGANPSNISFSHNGKYCCGSSIFVGNCMGAGTFGAIVKDANGNHFGLTNNHVTGACGYTDVDTPIVAPGPIDVSANGVDPFTIGRHFRVHPLQSGTPENYDVSGNIDAALFNIKNIDLVSSMQGDKYDTPTETASPAGSMIVEKVGRTTGYTTGVVKGKSVGYERVGATLREHKFNSVLYFKNVWVVQSGAGASFADPGDSGSLVVNREPGEPPKAVGLVFARSPVFTFICPIDDVLNYFGVTLVGGLT